MIYIKTSLKKVPACCTKCKYSGTRCLLIDMGKEDS